MFCDIVKFERELCQNFGSSLALFMQLLIVSVFGKEAALSQGKSYACVCVCPVPGLI